MKTTIKCVLAAMLCGVVLCGCGKSEGSGSTPEPSKQSEAAKESFSKIPPQSRPGGGPGK